MKDHTATPEIAAQMALAHKALGSWQAVASMCGDNPRTGRPVSGTLAWHYGMGRRPVPEAIAESWQANVTPDMLKSWAPRQRVPRVSIEVSPPIAAGLRALKRQDETWNDTFTRIFADSEPGGAGHLFTMLSNSTLIDIIDELEAMPDRLKKLGYWSDPAELRGIEYLISRAKIELSCAHLPPDWARQQEQDSDYAYEVRPPGYYERF